MMRLTLPRESSVLRIARLEGGDDRRRIDSSVPLATC